MKTTHIKLLGIGDHKTLTLRDNLMAALRKFYGDVELSLISSLDAIEASGVSSIPALIINEHLVTEGNVLSSQEIVLLLERERIKRPILKTKNYPNPPLHSS